MNWIKSNKLLIQTIFFIGIFLFIVTRIPQEIDWTPNYMHTDERPYGSKILFDRLEDIFTEEIVTYDNSLYEMFKTDSLDFMSENSNQIIITDRFRPDSAELAMLLDYVYNGSDVFISSTRISNDLLDTLDLKMDYENHIYGLSQTNYELTFLDVEKNVDSSYLVKATVDPEGYSSRIMANDARAISLVNWKNTSNDKLQVHLKKPFGKGNFYIHSYPYVFTNYHMLKPPVEHYIAKSLAYMPDRKTVWNAYYKPGVGKSDQHSLSVINDYKGTRYAYYLIIGAVFFYALFNLKRKQRIIPVVKPPRNIREDYIKTIGNLHLTENTNSVIARKKIKFFKDHLASTLGLRDISFSDEDASYIARRTGKDEAEIKALFNNIRGIQSDVVVSDVRLDKLVNKINYIYGYRNPVQKP